MRLFHSSGSCSSGNSSASIACSSSKRRMMWRLYVASSDSTRIGEGGMQLLQAREEVAPERHRAADQVLPHAALRLVHAERDAAGERRALECRVDLMLVEPVAELVHRPEEAAEML